MKQPDLYHLYLLKTSCVFGRSSMLSNVVGRVGYATQPRCTLQGCEVRPVFEGSLTLSGRLPHGIHHSHGDHPWVY